MASRASEIRQIPITNIRGYGNSVGGCLSRIAQWLLAVYTAIRERVYALRNYLFPASVERLASRAQPQPQRQPLAPPASSAVKAASSVPPTRPSPYPEGTRVTLAHEVWRKHLIIKPDGNLYVTITEEDLTGFRGGRYETRLGKCISTKTPIEIEASQFAGVPLTVEQFKLVTEELTTIVRYTRVPHPLVPLDLLESIAPLYN